MLYKAQLDIVVGLGVRLLQVMRLAGPAAASMSLGVVRDAVVFCCGPWCPDPRPVAAAASVLLLPPLAPSSFLVALPSRSPRPAATGAMKPPCGSTLMYPPVSIRVGHHASGTRGSMPRVLCAETYLASNGQSLQPRLRSSKPEIA